MTHQQRRFIVVREDKKTETLFVCGNSLNHPWSSTTVLSESEAKATLDSMRTNHPRETYYILEVIECAESGQLNLPLESDSEPF